MSVHLGGRLSPNNDRIQKLSDRLKGIQSTLESDKVTKVDDLERRLQVMEEQFWEMQDENTKKFAILREMMSKLGKGVEEERQARESFIDFKGKELLSVSEKIQEAADLSNNVTLTQARRESEHKISRLIEDRTSSLKQELLREIKLRNEACENLKRYVDDDLPKLQSTLKDEINRREELEQNILNLVTDELSRVQGEIDEEKKFRESESVYRVMSSVMILEHKL